MSSKAERQLKELRRLMPWTWDARVEKHPPGEKALKDFENVLSIKEQPRTRKTGSATKTGGPGSSSVNGGSTGPQLGAEPTPHNRRPQQQQPSEQQPSERHSAGKRHSPSGQPSRLENGDGDGGKVARLDVETACKRTSLPGRPSLGEAELPVEATPAVPRTRGVHSPVAFPTGKTPAASVCAGTPDSALLQTGAPSTVLASCPHDAALTGAHFKPTPCTVATAARPTTVARPNANKTAAGSAFHPLRLQLLPSTETGKAAATVREEEEADQDVSKVALPASAPAAGEANRKGAAAEAAASKACAEGGDLAAEQLGHQQQSKATLQPPEHHDVEGRLEPRCPEPILGHTDSDLTVPVTRTAVVANPAATNIGPYQGSRKQQQEEEDFRERPAVRVLGAAADKHAASKQVAAAAFTEAASAAVAAAGQAAAVLPPVQTEPRPVVNTDVHGPAAGTHLQMQVTLMGEAGAAIDRSKAGPGSSGLGCSSAPLAAAAAATMSRPSTAHAESAPTTLPTPAVAEGLLLDHPQQLLGSLPAPKPAAAGSIGEPVFSGASLPAAGPVQQRQQQQHASGLPHLALTGLEAATPPQGLLPEPPVLATLQTFRPLKQQHHQPLVQEGRVPSPQQQQNGVGGCAPAGACPAEAAATTNPGRQPPPPPPQQQHGNRHLKPAGGISKPPRKHAGRVGAKGGRRSPTVLAQVLTALSQLPAVASPLSCHHVQPQAPAALPLFRAGSLPQGTAANATSCLRRTKSEAAAALPDLESLLRALPKAPLVGGKAASAAPAAAAAAKSAPSGVEAGACPPLFKQRCLASGHDDQAPNKPTGVGQLGLLASTTAGVAEAAGWAAAAAAAAGPEAMDVDTQSAGADAETGPAGLGRAPMVQLTTQHSKGAAAAAAAAAAATVPVPVDKENLCTNAPTSARPRKPVLPSATGQPLASSPAATGTTSMDPAATTANVGQLTGGTLAARPTPAAGGATTEEPAARAAAVAAASRRAGAAPVQLSAWRLQQLDALSRAQHARERRLLLALGAGRAAARGTLAHASPAAVAAPPVTSGLAGPPLCSSAAATAGFLLPPLPRHPSQPGRPRAGGAAGPGSGSHLAAEGRLASVSAGRVSKACGSGRSPAATCAGRHLMMGAALARACTLLLQSRVTDWGPAPVAPWVH